MAMLDYRRANGFPEKTSLFELNFIKHLAISSGSRKTHHLPANVGRYTMHHHGPIGRLRSKCNAPSLKFLLFQLDHSSFFSGIFKGQSYHLGHLLAHWGFVGTSCSLKMSLFQNPQLLFSGYSCLVNAFQSFWVVLLLVDLLVWMGCIKNMARPLHGDRM